jgi:hypothetical protein
VLEAAHHHRACERERGGRGVGGGGDVGRQGNETRGNT